MKRYKWLLGLALLFSLGALGGCQKAQEKKVEESRYKIYYLNNSQTQVVSEPYEMEAVTVEEQLLELVGALNTRKPSDLTYRKALPDNVSITVEANRKKQQASVIVGSNYNLLTGVSEILCRAAIVKTLCQIDGIAYVEFVVDGQALTNSQDVPVGFMTAEDFIDNTGGETNYEQNAHVTLFFANKAGDRLKETRVNIRYDGTIPIEQLVVEQLIRGPESISGVEEGQLFPTVSKDAKLVRVTVKDGICYADFNEEFLSKPSGITDEAAIYSVVNTLVELPKINKVQFTINGKQVASFAEGMEFDISFERNLDMVESEE